MGIFSDLTAKDLEELRSNDTSVAPSPSEKDLGLYVPEMSQTIAQVTPPSEDGKFPWKTMDDYSQRHRELLAKAGINKITNQGQANKAEGFLDSLETANIEHLTNMQLHLGENIDTDADSFGNKGLAGLQDISSMPYRKIAPLLKSFMESIAVFGQESFRGTSKTFLDPSKRINELLGTSLPTMEEGDDIISKTAAELYKNMDVPYELEESIERDRVETINYLLRDGEWLNAAKMTATNFGTDMGVFLVALSAGTGVKMPLGAKEAGWAKRTIDAIKTSFKFGAFEAIRNPADDSDYRKAVTMAATIAAIPFTGQATAAGLKKATGGKIGGDWTAAISAALTSLGISGLTGDMQKSMDAAKKNAEEMGKPEKADIFQVISLIPYIGNAAAMGLMTRAVRAERDPQKMIEDNTPIKIEGENKGEVKGESKSELKPESKEVQDENARIQGSKQKEEGISPKEKDDTLIQLPELPEKAQNEGLGALIPPIPKISTTPQEFFSEALGVVTGEVSITKPAQVREKANFILNESKGDYDPTPVELLEKVKSFPSKFDNIFNRITTFASGSREFRKARQEQLAGDINEAMDYLDKEAFDKVRMTYDKPDLTPNDLMDAALEVRDSFVRLKKDYELAKLTEIKDKNIDSLMSRIRNVKELDKADSQDRMAALNLMDYILKDKEYAASKMGKIAKSIEEGTADNARLSFPEIMDEIKKYADFSDRKVAIKSIAKMASDLKGRKMLPELSDGISTLVNHLDTRTKSVIKGESKYSPYLTINIQTPISGIMKLIDAFGLKGEGRKRIEEAGLDIEALDERIEYLSDPKTNLKSRAFGQWKAQDIQAINDVLGMAKQAQLAFEKARELSFESSQEIKILAVISALNTSPTKKEFEYGAKGKLGKYANSTGDFIWGETFEQSNHLDTILYASLGKSEAYKWFKNKLYDMANIETKNHDALNNKLFNRFRERNLLDNEHMKLLPSTGAFNWMKKKIGIDKIDYKLSDAQTLTLTPEQMIHLRLMARTDRGRKTLLTGEVVKEADVKDAKGKAGVAFEAESRPYLKLTNNEFNALMSKDVYGKDSAKFVAFEDAVWDFYNKDLKDFGNNASRRIDGYDRFTDPNYFHISRKGEYIKAGSSVDWEADGFKSKLSLPENAGRFKETSPHARARLEVKSVLQELEESIWQMSRYDAYAEGLREIRGVMRDQKVIEAFRANQGEQRWKNTKKMLSRIYGETSTAEGLGLLDKISGNVNTSLVALSLSAIAKQPLAMITAIPQVGATNIAKAVAHTTDPRYRQLFKDVLNESALTKKRFEGTLIGEQIGKLAESEAFRSALTGQKSLRDKQMALIRQTDKIGLRVAIGGAIEKAMSEKGITIEDYMKMDGGTKQEFLDVAGREAWDSLLNGGQAVYGKSWASVWQGSDSSFKKALGVFHSPVDQILTRQYRNWLDFKNSKGEAGDFFKLIGDSLMGYGGTVAGSAVITTLLSYAKSPKDKRDKMNKEEFLTKLGLNTAGEALGTPYYLGDAVKGVISKLQYGKLSSGVMTNPTLEMLDDLDDLVTQSIKRYSSKKWNSMSREKRDEEAMKLWVEIAKLTGKASGISAQGIIDMYKIGKTAKEDVIDKNKLFKKGNSLSQEEIEALLSENSTSEITPEAIPEITPK